MKNVSSGILTPQDADETPIFWVVFHSIEGDIRGGRRSAVEPGRPVPPPGLNGRFSIAANVKPRLITSYRHLIPVLRFGSPVTRGSRFFSRSASGRLMMG